ncbi:MAG: Fur family transcriptional regulator [Candidatus Nanopelagicales bacterium]
MSSVASSVTVPGVRATKQRTAVVGLLERVDDFRSAQDLYEMLRRRKASIGLTTVYRTLQALAESGDVDVLRTDDGESLYRLCRGGRQHHHHMHLVCRRCGRAVEVEGPEVEQWAHRLAEEHGWSDVSHNVEIFGTCEECAAAPTS